MGFPCKFSKTTKRWLYAFTLLSIFGLLFVDYAYYGKLSSRTIKAFRSWRTQDRLSAPVRLPADSSEDFGGENKSNSSRKLPYAANRKSDFDIRSSDVIVFLHIQKTGGSALGRHLVKHLKLDQPCNCQVSRKRCRCYRPKSNSRWWLFSRYSTGWGCGLHADWTELTSCVDGELDKMEQHHMKRRYFYITILREPVARFLSEFKHVQRGATWKGARFWCGGREATKAELQPCYDDIDWAGVTIDEFMACNTNLATNRQTRMLADLSLVGCYNTSLMSKNERDLIMLASAKENLQKMAYFALCEYQQISQYMFERTFNLHFTKPFVQFNETHVTQSIEEGEITEKDIENIKRHNYLDMQLYDYAKDLLLKRHQHLLMDDPDYNNCFKNLGEVQQRSYLSEKKRKKNRKSKG